MPPKSSGLATPASSPTTAEGAAAPLPSEGVRTALSLALFIHFFLLAAGVLSTGTSSELERLARRIPFLTRYVQMLGLDASYQFHLAYGEPADFDYFVTAELETADGQTVTREFPAIGVMPGHRHRRLERLARRIGAPPPEEEADPVDRLARRLAEYWVAETGAVRGMLRAPEANVVLIREEGVLTRPRWSNAADFRERYFQGGFQAHIVIVDERVELMRAIEAGETAPPPAGTR